MKEFVYMDEVKLESILFESACTSCFVGSASDNFNRLIELGKWKQKEIEDEGWEKHLNERDQEDDGV